MIDIVMMSSLAMWANVPPEPEGGIRKLTQEQKLAHLEQWKPILDVRQKLVAAFRPKEEETDVFIYAFTGERLSYPSCVIEQILTDEEIKILEDFEDDPVLELMTEGWSTASAMILESISP